MHTKIRRIGFVLFTIGIIVLCMLAYTGFTWQIVGYQQGIASLAVTVLFLALGLLLITLTK